MSGSAYCWACGERGCSAEHPDADRSDRESYCQRCGSYCRTYNCQTCDELVCWECGLKGGDGYEPDTGFYVCGQCV